MHPLEAIANVALGTEPVVLFLWHYHVIKAGNEEWQLDSDLALWRQCKAYCQKLEQQGLLVSQACQGGFAYQKVKADSELSCQEWRARHHQPCGGYRIGCSYCPNA